MLSFWELFGSYNNLQGKVGATASELATENIYMNKAYISVCTNSSTLALQELILCFSLPLHIFFNAISVLAHSVAKAEEMEEVTTASLAAAAVIFLSSCEHLHTTFSAWQQGQC